MRLVRIANNASREYGTEDGRESKSPGPWKKNGKFETHQYAVAFRISDSRFGVRNVWVSRWRAERLTGKSTEIIQALGSPRPLEGKGLLQRFGERCPELNDHVRSVLKPSESLEDLFER